MTPETRKKIEATIRKHHMDGPWHWIDLATDEIAVLLDAESEPLEGTKEQRLSDWEQMCECGHGRYRHGEIDSLYHVGPCRILGCGCKGLRSVVRPAAFPQPEPRECSGMFAAWCPIHGDCTCRDNPSEDGDWSEDPACPLHGLKSDHAERPVGESAPPAEPRERWACLACTEGAGSHLRETAWHYRGEICPTTKQPHPPAPAVPASAPEPTTAQATISTEVLVRNIRRQAATANPIGITEITDTALLVIADRLEAQAKRVAALEALLGRAESHVDWCVRNHVQDHFGTSSLAVMRTWLDDARHALAADTGETA